MLYSVVPGKIFSCSDHPQLRSRRYHAGGVVGARRDVQQSLVTARVLGLDEGWTYLFPNVQ